MTPGYFPREAWREACEEQRVFGEWLGVGQGLANAEERGNWGEGNAYSRVLPAGRRGVAGGQGRHGMNDCHYDLNGPG